MKTKLIIRKNWIYGLVGAVFLLQFIELLVQSQKFWHRFFLGSDFAVYNQAWQLIGRGNLNPYMTIYPYNYPHYGYPFYQSHFELMMWPLALIHLISSSSLTLLFIQDLAIVLTGITILLWTRDILTKAQAGPIFYSVMLVGTALAWVAIPWVYYSAFVDFHSWTLATFPLVVAAWFFWKEKTNKYWICIFITLLFGAVAAIYVVGLGLSGLISSKTRRLSGTVMILVGLAWIALVTYMGADHGSSLAPHYGYLINQTASKKLSFSSLVIGILFHPSSVLKVLNKRFYDVYRFVGSEGAIGILSPWGLGVPVVVLLANSLNVSPSFIQPFASFQNIPVLPFVEVGTVMTIVFLWSKNLCCKVLAIFGAVLAIGQIVFFSWFWLPRAYRQPIPSKAAAKELSIIKNKTKSSNYEIVVSSYIMGRFSRHSLVFPLIYPNQQIPIFDRRVVFILASPPGSPQTNTRTVNFITKLKATKIVAKKGVYGFIWSPPVGLSNINIP